MRYCAGQIKYLTAIKELKDKGGRIRCVNISNLLGLVSVSSRSSVRRSISAPNDSSASAASPPSLISAPPESSCAISCQSSMEAWQFLSVSRRSSSASKRLFSRSTGVSFSGAFHASGAESSFSISARRADREGWSKTPPERLELRGQRRDAAFQISKLKHWKSLSFG